MLEGSDLVNAVLFFAPGFLLVYTFKLVTQQRPRSHFQAAVWSVIASVPVRWGGAQLVSRLDPGVSQGLDLELYLLGLALVAGIIPGLAKQLFFFGEEEQAQAMPSGANDN
jgi:hypothetical protein